MKLTGGALIIAGIAGLGFAIYKGWIKIPNILGLLPGDVGRGAQEVPGIPGAIGGATYNIFNPGDTTLKERALDLSVTIAREEDIPIELAFEKAVAQEGAGDVHEGPFGTGFPGAITPILSGYTIGAGLGVIDRWNRYLEGLPFSKKREARLGEYERRANWMWEHPVESMIGFPAQIIHEATKPEGAPSAPLFTLLPVATAGLGKVLPYLVPGMGPIAMVAQIQEEAERRALKPEPEPEYETGVFYKIGPGELTPASQAQRKPVETAPITQLIPKSFGGEPTALKQQELTVQQWIDMPLDVKIQMEADLKSAQFGR